MDRKSKLKILLIIVCVLGAVCSIYIPNSKLNDAIKETENIIINEIKVSEQTEELAIQTKESINNDEIIETQEVIQSSVEEEQEVNDESALETDGVVEQENISYDGVNTGNGLNLLGKYQGLTYYSQADSRWANKMYSSINDKSQIDRKSVV